MGKWNAWNESFFDRLTPDAAYVIGFIIADGHIEGDRSRIGISQKDPEPLLRIARAIDFEGGLHLQKGNMYALRLASKHATKILIEKYGLPRGGIKSYVVRIPSNIPDELMPHLIRGFFDGDGCISVAGSPIYIRFVSGSLGLIDDVSNILATQVGISTGRRSKRGHIKKNGQRTESYGAQWISQREIMSFAQYIYGSERDVYGSDLYLRRKKEKFDGLFVPWRDYDWLYQEYVQRGRSKKNIGKEFNIPPTLVGRWLSCYGLNSYEPRD